MPQFSIHIFSEAEEGLYLRLRDWRDQFTKPLIAFLAKSGVTPNMLSITGLLMLIFFIYFFSFNPWLALIFLVLNTVFDLLDGSLARFLHKDSLQGTLFDVVCDHIGFFVVFLTFIYFHFINPFWGAIYLLNYPIFLFLIIILRSAKVHVGPVIRSKYYIYLLFLIWLLSGYQLLDIAVVFFSIYMMIENLFLLHKLRCILS